MNLIFWASLVLSVYSYALYPLLLLGLNALFRRGAAQGGNAGVTLTLITTAYNEEARIRDKLENLLALEHPGLELIVASDCSADTTDSIVGEYAGRGVKLVRAAARLGKENAQLSAIRASTGNVLVFSDVATSIRPGALQLLAGYFADPTVGAVSSEDRFVAQDGKVAGEGAYVRYEMWLRRLESRRAGLVGLSGSFFAARREVCDEWDIHSPSDFNTALNCARGGLRAVTAPDVHGFYKDVKNSRSEFTRKVRTVLRGMTAIARHPDVLNPFRFGLFSWQVWSHKILRWSVPFTLATLLLSNVFLLEQGGIYMIALVAQASFYACAALAHFSSSLRSFGPVRIVYYFAQANLGIAWAFLLLCAGRRMTVWQPTTR